MKDVVFFLALISGFIFGQSYAYVVVSLNRSSEESAAVSECKQPPEIVHMQAIMERMRLPVLNSIEQREHEIDLIAQLIEEDLK